MTKRDLKAEAIDLGARHIAHAIRAWDKRSAADMIEMLEAPDEFCAANVCRTEEYVDITALPSEEIPTDVAKDYFVWAMDADENLVVGSGFRSTLTLAEYRERRARPD